MNIEKDEFISIVRHFESAQEERKEINDEINDKIKSVASSHNIEPKVLKQAIRKYLKYEADKETYLEEDCAIDNILNVVIDDSTWGQNNT